MTNAAFIRDSVHGSIERLPTRKFLLLGALLLGAIQDLHQQRRPLAHTRVERRLAALDVVANILEERA